MISFLRAVWLVAWREYKSTAKTRSFIITLAIIPIMLVGSTVVQTMIRPPQGSAYTIVDATGRYAPEIARQETLNYQRDVLIRLSEYVQRWHLDPYVKTTALGGGSHRWFNDADVAAFNQAGGAGPVLKTLKPHLPADAPAFEYPTQWLFDVPPPSSVPTDKGPEAFGKAIEPLMQKTVATPAGPRQLATAVYIPADFGPDHMAVRIWTNGRPSGTFLDNLRDQLTAMVRTETMGRDGLTGPQIAQLETLSPVFDVHAPPPGGGRDQVLIKSALPLALSYLLFISIMVSGMKMLLGVIEERSNKLLESILACISPQQLMYGKLLGVVALGLTAVIVWVGCAVLGAYTMHGQMADFLRPALSSLQSPWTGVALGVYFISGYLIMAMILLAIGSVSNSMQDAQGYMQPIMMLVIIPYITLVSSMITNPHSLLPRIMSWIPFYTPYAMLARLGTGVPLWEILGTGALMFAFIVLEMIWLGRLFQNNLLNTGQKFKLSSLFGKKAA